MKRISLRDEIGQSRDFPSVGAEVYLNLLRTVEALTEKPTAILRRAGLSHSQYNVLRILRGAGTEGLSCGQIADRMVTRDSDMTRLLSGLQKSGLVERYRCADDRRVILALLTPPGRQKLKDLDKPIADIHVLQLKHMAGDQLQNLSRLLEDARQCPDP